MRVVAGMAVPNPIERIDPALRREVSAQLSQRLQYRFRQSIYTPQSPTPHQTQHRSVEGRRTAAASDGWVRRRVQKVRPEKARSVPDKRWTAVSSSDEADRGTLIGCWV